MISIERNDEHDDNVLIHITDGTDKTTSLGIAQTFDTAIYGFDIPDVGISLDRSEVIHTGDEVPFKNIISTIKKNKKLLKDTIGPHMLSGLIDAIKKQINNIDAEKYKKDDFYMYMNEATRLSNELSVLDQRITMFHEKINDLPVLYPTENRNRNRKRKEQPVFSDMTVQLKKIYETSKLLEENEIAVRSEIKHILHEQQIYHEYVNFLQENSSKKKRVINKIKKKVAKLHDDFPDGVTSKEVYEKRLHQKNNELDMLCSKREILSEQIVSLQHEIIFCGSDFPDKKNEIDRNDKSMIVLKHTLDTLEDSDEKENIELYSKQIDTFEKRDVLKKKIRVTQKMISIRSSQVKKIYTDPKEFNKNSIIENLLKEIYEKEQVLFSLYKQRDIQSTYLDDISGKYIDKYEQIIQRKKDIRESRDMYPIETYKRYLIDIGKDEKEMFTEIRKLKNKTLEYITKINYLKRQIKDLENRNQYIFLSILSDLMELQSSGINKEKKQLSENELQANTLKQNQLKKQYHIEIQNDLAKKEEKQQLLNEKYRQILDILLVYAYQKNTFQKRIDTLYAEYKKHDDEQTSLFDQREKNEQRIYDLEKEILYRDDQTSGGDDQIQLGDIIDPEKEIESLQYENTTIDKKYNQINNLKKGIRKKIDNITNEYHAWYKKLFEDILLFDKKFPEKFNDEDRSSLEESAELVVPRFDYQKDDVGYQRKKKNCLPGCERPGINGGRRSSRDKENKLLTGFRKH